MADEKKENPEPREESPKFAAPPKVSVKKPENGGTSGNKVDLSKKIPAIRKPGEDSGDDKPEDDPANTAMIVLPPDASDEKAPDAGPPPAPETPKPAPAAGARRESREDSGSGRSGDDPANTAMIVLPPDASDEKASKSGDSSPPEAAKTAPDAGSEAPRGDASESAQGDSSQTIHIQLPDSELPPEPSSSEKKPIAPTVRLKRPPAAKPSPPSGTSKASPAGRGSPEKGKSATSRIPLSAATPAIATGKTVRAARPSGEGGPPKPGSHPLPSLEKPPSEAQVQAAKGKTSRISLNDALGVAGDEASSSPGTPKTIRLKRPGSSEAPTVQAKPTLSASKPTVSADGADGAGETRKHTAKLPEGLAEGEGESATRRKTIKVRRPEETPVPGLGSEEEPAEEMAPGGAPVPGSDSVHWVFVASSIAAVLVGVLLVWVLAAQAFGPDKSLTRFSSWPNGPRLWMPGSGIQQR